MRLKITYVIPAGLMLLSLWFSLIFYWQTSHQAAEIIREQSLDKVKLDITRLQNILYNLLTEEFTDMETAKLNLSVTAMDNDIKKLLLVDEYNEVIISNRYNWRNKKASQVSNYSLAEASKIKNKNSSMLNFSDEKKSLLEGYYPVVLHLENVRGQPIKRRGVLYVEFSLENKLKRANYIALNQSLTIAAVLFAISILSAIILHLFISNRLSLLTSVARKISSGNLEEKSSLSGNDELSELSAAFDDMTDRLKSDIQRRKMAEERLRDVNENLEEIVRQRTSELEEKKHELLESQALAHHANKMVALGEMAGGMAHEINSPLQAITLSTYKLRGEKLSEKLEQRKTIAEDIDSSVYRISNIIESLRKMSRGSTADPFDTVTLKEIVDNVIGITRERYFIKGIQFTTTYHDNCEIVKAECQQTLIGQVVMNLLNNAYDAVKEEDEKWINLDIKTEGDNACFIVSDSGHGIVDEMKEKIFEPMFTTKGIDEGTGLGLSISMQIASKHNGSLKLDSSSKQTRFILTIPLRQEQKK